MAAAAGHLDGRRALEPPLNNHIECPDPFDLHELRVLRFLNVVRSNPHLQLELKNAKTPGELCALSRRYGFPIELADIHLFYAQWEEPFWPWSGRSKQARRCFVHEGYLPPNDP